MNALPSGSNLLLLLEAIAGRCFLKKLVLKFSQNSWENTRASVSFFKLQTEVCNFIKKETDTVVFLRNLQNFLGIFFRTPHVAAFVSH